MQNSLRGVFIKQTPLIFFPQALSSSAVSVVVTAADVIFDGLLHGCCDRSGTHIFRFIPHV